MQVCRTTYASLADCVCLCRQQMQMPNFHTIFANPTNVCREKRNQKLARTSTTTQVNNQIPNPDPASTTTSTTPAAKANSSSSVVCCFVCALDSRKLQPCRQITAKGNDLVGPIAMVVTATHTHNTQRLIA